MSLATFLGAPIAGALLMRMNYKALGHAKACLLYTSDAADERSSVDLGGRRIIKKTHERSDQQRSL